MKKRIIIPSVLLVIVFIFLFFLSTIAKNYVNKNGEELTSRKILINELHIDYFNLKVTVDGFTLFEENKTDTFVSFDQLLIDFNPWKLFNKEFSFSQIQLSNSYINIEQNDDIFNFTSLIEHFNDTTNIETEAVDNDTTQSDIKYSITDFKLITGRFKYYDKSIDNLIEVDDINLQLPEFAWDSQSSKMGLEFAIGKEGSVIINTTVSEQLAYYKVNFQTKNIQLNNFTNYLKESVNITDFNGYLQSNINIEGSLKETSEVKIDGVIAVDSLIIIDGNNNELLSSKSIKTELEDIDIAKNSFVIKNVIIDEPNINATLGKAQSNFEYFFAPIINSADTIEQEETPNTPQEPETEIYYNIKEFVVNNGKVIFRDSTLNRSFKYDISNIDLKVADINTTNRAIPVDYSMNFINDGNFKGKAIIDSEEPTNLTYNGKISHLDLHSFSPYTEYHLGYPINSGLFYYTCDIEMNPTELLNENDIFVQDIEFGKSTGDTTAAKVPLKLAMVILKDSKDNVEMNVPVRGNPSEPGFRLGKIMLKTFGKFLVKAAASPFGALGKMVGTTADELDHIPFEYTQDSMAIKQKNTLDKIAKILVKKPDLIFTFRQDLSMDDETYFLSEKAIKEKYITEKMSSKNLNWLDIKDNDEKFVSYVDKLSPETTGIPMSERYSSLTDENTIKTSFKDLYNKRNNAIVEYLTVTKGCKPTSVKTLSADFENMPEELKNPSFKVDVGIR
ncbi:DUF748 domain-containing protein [Saccharicrinis aurantiacus]|uniref:DUF748 domain-containing protein n=1 Tax=Saccharicrinis aurantiacus TaxID=1849719 RepID=UPI002492AE08|nr:DUF748 domain-containing protein [Saccharicrinis aurantiacus]